jgi:hypothetical protein
MGKNKRALLIYGYFFILNSLFFLKNPGNKVVFLRCLEKAGCHIFSHLIPLQSCGIQMLFLLFAAKRAIYF